MREALTAFTIAYCYGENVRRILFAFGHYSRMTMAERINETGVQIEVQHFDCYPQGNLPWIIEQAMKFAQQAFHQREKIERLISEQLTMIYNQAPVWFRRTLDDAT